MKYFFLIIFLPLFSTAQTIHYKDDNIVYEGRVNLAGFAENNPAARLAASFEMAVKESGAKTKVSTAGSDLQAFSQLKLSSPFAIIRTLHFTMNLATSANGYSYKIDSVFVTEKRRGSTEKEFTAKELLEGIEQTGASAAETEKLLNEIDLRLQKLLTILQNRAAINPAPAR